MNWYLIYTKRRQEERARTNLVRQGIDCYLPTLQVQKRVRREVTWAVEPLFPRYLFIRLDPAGGPGKGWSVLRSTKGVTRLVTFGTEPAIVDDQLVDALRARDEAHAPRPLFVEGERVRVTTGPFSGIEGVYKMADGERRALVLIEFLRKPASLQVELSHLERQAVENK